MLYFMYFIWIFHCFNTDAEVIKAIKWSENLDDIFRTNYEKDPRLSWQYFGSTTGFMRQFPGIYFYILF